MKVKIYPCKLHGVIDAVPSKSYAHRYFLGAMLADGKTEIVMNGISGDVAATIKCIENLGGKVRIHGNRYKVTPIWENFSKNRILDCKESASTLRFLFPIICALGCGGTFIGDGRLRERPIAPLIAASDGCEISGEALPITVNGKMKGGKIVIPTDISSQYITGLLYALPLLDNDSEIIYAEPPVSAPYIDMTAESLKAFNIYSEKTDNGFKIKGKQIYRSPANLEVEGDWSAAAFWTTANIIGNAVRVKGLNPDSLQGDKAINKILAEFRCGGTTVDCKNIPDLAPCLAVAAAYTETDVRLEGVSRLRLKESNRLNALQNALTALGGSVEQTDNCLIIHGRGGLNGGEIDSFGDHRIVMSMAVAATKATSPVIINGAEAVAKSYPTFFDDFSKTGGKYEYI